MARGRNVINQSIALEGGDEIIALLKKMGTEGEAAARKLEQAFGRVEIKQGIQASFIRLRKSLADLQVAGGKVATSFGNVTASVGKVSGAFAAARGKVLLYTAALTGAAAGAAAFVNSSLNRIDDLGDLASSIGASTTEIQGLMAAGAQAGVDGKDFIKTIATLGEGMQELQQNTGEAAGGFGKLGVEFKQFGDKTVTIHRGIAKVGDEMGKTGKKSVELSDRAKALQKVFSMVGIRPGTKLVPMDVLRAIAGAFSKMKDGAEKTQLAVDLLGPQLGPRLIPFLNMGAAAVDTWAGKLEGVNALLNSDEVANGGKAADNIAFLAFVFRQFADKLTAQFAPDISNAVDTIFMALKENAAGVRAFITDTGKAIGTLIADITKLATGDRAHVQNQWIVTLYDWIVKTATAAEKFYNGVLVPGFEAVSKAAEPLAQLINGILGTSMTGTDVVIVGILFQLVGGFKLLASVVGLGLNVVGLLINTIALVPKFGALILDTFGLLGKGILAFGRLLPALAGLIGPQGLIAIAVIGLGVLIYAFWDDIVKYTALAFDFIVKAVSAGWEGVKTASSAIWEGMKTVYADTWTGIKTVAAEALAGISTVYSDSWEGLKTIATDARAGLIQVASDTWAGITSTVAAAREGLYTVARDTWGGIKTAADDLGLLLAPVWDNIRNTAAAAFQSIASLVVEAWSGASASVVESAAAIRDAIQTATSIAGDVAGAAEIANALVQPFREAQTQIREIMSTFGAIARSGMEQVASAVSSIGQQITAQIEAILSGLRRAVAEAQRLRAQASSSSAERRAGGGYIRGPGSGTSDSIPAWLSNGEFVIRAAAVRRYGVDFLRSINGMTAGINIRDAIGGFAGGGLVAMPRMAMPALALSGAGGASSALTLVIGGESFGGLSGPSDTIARLEKAMRARKIRSAGRPSPYASR